MSTTSPFMFPAPIGGVPLSNDLVPCILFVCLYAGLIGVAIWRICKPESRNMTAIMALFFVTERTVVWSLRAWISQTPSEDNSSGLVTYFQIAFNAGYMAVWGKLVFLLRSIVVNTTKGTSNSASTTGVPLDEVAKKHADIEARTSSPRSDMSFGSQAKLSTTTMIETVAELEDQPRVRHRYRRAFGYLSLAALVPFIFAAVMGHWYPNAEHDAKKAKGVGLLRLVVSVMCLALIVGVQVLAVLAIVKARKIRRGPVVFVLIIALIIMIIPIYQLAIMQDLTSSITSTAPGSQNTSGEKALFYVLQVAPEYLCVAALLCVNMRRMYGTGMWGDKMKDPKPRSRS